MKIKLPFFTKVFVLALISAFALSSCNKSNQQVFQKRKYMPWFAQMKAKKDFKQNAFSNEVREPNYSNEVLHVENTPQLEQSDLPVKSRALKTIGKRRIVKNATKAKARFDRKPKSPQPIKAKAEKWVNQQKPILRKDFAQKSVDRIEATDTSWKIDEEESDIALLLLLILAVLLPPLAVFLVRGLGLTFVISLILSLLFWVPGIIFALIVIFAD